MPLASARTINVLSETKDFTGEVNRLIGNLDNVAVFFNHILVATYVRSEKTAGGIIRPDKNKDEDVYQGKVGLVLKKGPMAFVDDAEIDFLGQNVHPNDWVVYRVGDGFDLTIRGVACRMLADRNIKLRIPDPEIVF
jgi:co-chaperonin GroES (HSP10)